MAVSSVPPPSSFAPSQDSLATLATRKNGIGHGTVISDIKTQGGNAAGTANSGGQIGSKVDKTV